MAYMGVFVTKLIPTFLLCFVGSKSGRRQMQSFVSNKEDPSSINNSSGSTNNSATTMLAGRAAIAQLCSTSDKLSNLFAVAKCAGWAKRAGASMLFLPECFGFIGESSEQTLREAERIEPPSAMGAGGAASLLPALDHALLAKTTEGPRKKLAVALANTIHAHASDDRKGRDSTQGSDCEVSAKESDYLASLRQEVHCCNAEFQDGSSLGWPVILAGLRVIARESGLWISGGGMHESGAPPLHLSPLTSKSPAMPEDADETRAASTSPQAPQMVPPETGSSSGPKKRSRVYNTHVVIDNMGEVVCTYRKIHLFDVSIPSQNVYLKESNSTAPGTTLQVCDSPVGRLGLATCYDLRFPEMFTELTSTPSTSCGCEGRGGAQILLVPSAFTIPTGRAHWHVLLRARAVENQCYVLAAAQFGKHNGKRTSYGHSLAVDPWGVVLADAGGYDGPGVGGAVIGDGTGHAAQPPSGMDGGPADVVDHDADSVAAPPPSIVVCDIDLDKLSSVRERMPIRQHRDQSSFSW